MNQPSIDRLPTVLSRIGVSRSTLYKMIEQGKFNAPLRLGPRAVGWLSTDSDDFIAGRVQASRHQGEAA